MAGMEEQINEDGFFVIKGSLFEENSGKKKYNLWNYFKKINEYVVGEIASFKDNSQVTVNEDGEYIWKSQIEFSKEER